jgi:hypothetical protein
MMQNFVFVVFVKKIKNEKINSCENTHHQQTDTTFQFSICKIRFCKIIIIFHKDTAKRDR